jgi:hypothetical protein
MRSSGGPHGSPRWSGPMARPPKISVIRTREDFYGERGMRGRPVALPQLPVPFLLQHAASHRGSPNNLSPSCAAATPGRFPRSRRWHSPTGSTFSRTSRSPRPDGRRGTRTGRRRSTGGCSSTASSRDSREANRRTTSSTCCAPERGGTESRREPMRSGTSRRNGKHRETGYENWASNAGPSTRNGTFTRPSCGC